VVPDLNQLMLSCLSSALPSPAGKEIDRLSRVRTGPTHPIFGSGGLRGGHEITFDALDEYRIPIAGGHLLRVKKRHGQLVLERRRAWRDVSGPSGTGGLTVAGLALSWAASRSGQRPRAPATQPTPSGSASSSGCGRRRSSCSPTSSSPPRPAAASPGTGRPRKRNGRTPNFSAAPSNTPSCRTAPVRGTTSPAGSCECATLRRAAFLRAGGATDRCPSHPEGSRSTGWLCGVLSSEPLQLDAVRAAEPHGRGRDHVGRCRPGRVVVGQQSSGEFGGVQRAHHPQMAQGLLRQQQSGLGRQPRVLPAGRRGDPVGVVAALRGSEDPLTLAVRRVAHAHTVGRGAGRRRAVACPR